MAAATKRKTSLSLEAALVEAVAQARRKKWCAEKADAFAAQSEWHGFAGRRCAPWDFTGEEEEGLIDRQLGDLTGVTARSRLRRSAPPAGSRPVRQVAARDGCHRRRGARAAGSRPCRVLNGL